MCVYTPWRVCTSEFLYSRLLSGPICPDPKTACWKLTLAYFSMQFTDWKVSSVSKVVTAWTREYRFVSACTREFIYSRLLSRSVWSGSYRPYTILSACNLGMGTNQVSHNSWVREHASTCIGEYVVRDVLAYIYIRLFFITRHHTFFSVGYVFPCTPAWVWEQIITHGFTNEWERRPKLKTFVLKSGWL